MPLAFLQQVNVKKSEKLAKIARRRKYLYHLNDMMNFTKFFRKNVTCDNIKSH